MRLPDLNWVIDWEADNFMTELSRTGVPQLTITFSNRLTNQRPPMGSYRAELGEERSPQ